MSDTVPLDYFNPDYDISAQWWHLNYDGFDPLECVMLELIGKGCAEGETAEMLREEARERDRKLMEAFERGGSSEEEIDFEMVNYDPDIYTVLLRDK